METKNGPVIQARKPGDLLNAIGGKRTATPGLGCQHQQAGYEGDAFLSVPRRPAQAQDAIDLSCVRHVDQSVAGVVREETKVSEHVRSK